MVQGHKVRLVPIEERHSLATKTWANDPELMLLMNRARPVADDEHEQWFADLARRTDCLYFAIETADHGRHIGNVWLWDIDARHKRAEVRIVLGARESADRGLGSESIGLVTRYAFEQLSLHKVFAQVLATNPRARRAFEKAGFDLEGVLKGDRWAGDAYVDVFVLGRLR